jgi:hypothetical protein
VPSQSQLAVLHDEALSFQYGIQQKGSEADDALSGAFTKSGLKQAFLPTFLNQIELTQAVIRKINAHQPSDLAAAVNKLSIPVSVNARYGTWDAKQASLGSATHPDFLTLSTSPTPTPTTG